MQPISPILQTKIQQQSAIKQTNSNIKNTGLQQDIVEISNKNKNNTKTAIKIGGGIALATMATIAILKQRDLSKAKKELSALYDTIFENMSKNATDPINFEKPKLIFKKLNKTTGAQFITNTNEIEIDPRRLRRTSILKDLEKTHTTKIADGIEVADISYEGNIFDMFKKGMKDEFRMATKEEALAIEGSHLAHELMHAKQFQMLLSSEGGKEKYIQYLKTKNPDISQEDLQKLSPFIFSYKPKEIIPENITIAEELYGGPRFKYGFKNIIEAFTNYTNGNKFEYYTNLTEVSARNAEYSYWSKIIDGKLPKPEGISDEFLNSMKKKTEHNASVLMKAAANKAKQQN